MPAAAYLAAAADGRYVPIAPEPEGFRVEHGTLRPPDHATSDRVPVGQSERFRAGDLAGAV